MGGDLAPSLGDAKKFSRTFPEKISIFTPKNSDDLFLVIDQVFLILILSFQIFCVFIVSNVIYDPFFTTKSVLSTTKFLDDTYFSLSSSFRAHPTTLLLKILGGPMHGPSPHLKFGGDRPPRSPPLAASACTCSISFLRQPLTGRILLRRRLSSLSTRVLPKHSCPVLSLTILDPRVGRFMDKSTPSPSVFLSSFSDDILAHFFMSSIHRIFGLPCFLTPRTVPCTISTCLQTISFFSHHMTKV